MSRKNVMPGIAYDDQRKSYYVTLRIPAHNGQPSKRVVRCFKRIEDAIHLLDQHNGNVILAQGAKVSSLTLGQWLGYWLEEMIQPSRTASTTHGYGMMIKNHISPALGSIALRDLSTAQIQQYLNRKMKQGLCSNTVRKHYTLLHNALQHAVRQELLNRNPADNVIPPSISQPSHHYYDSDTLAQLFKMLEGTSMEPVVKLAGYLGLRRSEICGLKWKHVDRKEKIITIVETRTSVNGRPVDKSTKTRSSIRRLGYQGIQDLDDMIEKLWAKRQSEMAALGDAYMDGDYVLCHDGGQPYQADYLSNRLQRIMRKSDMPYVTLHGLRHSFASIANSRNVPIFGISKALGHSTTNTTSQIYTHLFDDTHLNVVQAVGEAITACRAEKG